MVAKIKSLGSSSPSSMIVDKVAKPGNDSSSHRQLEGTTNCLSTAVAATKEMAHEFSVAKDGIRTDCLAGEMLEYDDDDCSAVSGPETRDDDDDGQEAGPEFDAVCAAGPMTSKSPGCGTDMPGRCKMDLSYAFHQNDKFPSTERKGEGIEYLFELVESSLCGGCDAGKRGDGVSHDNRISSKDLPTYNMMPDLRKDSLTEDESAVSRSAHSSRTQRTSSSRSRGRTTSRNRAQVSTRRRRPSDDEATRHRSRSSSDRSDRREETLKKKVSEKIAKKATAFIRENVDPTQTNVDKQGKSKILKSGLRPSSFLKQDRLSAFDDLSISRASDSQITEMRELCVLNIGSASSVSSYDGDGPSWSQHTKQDRKMSTSSMSVMTALTENTSNKTSSVSESDVSEIFHRVMRMLVNFLYSFSTVMYGEGAAAPVNKAVCLASLGFLAVFWPEDREKSRVRIERKEVPRPEKVSLLHLVTRGGS